MTGTFQGFQIQYEEKSLKAAELAKAAAEKTHTVYTAKMKSQKAFHAIASGDKATMWHTLQEYLRDYAAFINSIARITGLCVCKVDEEFYNRVTIDDIKKQLRMIVGFVYAHEAVNSAAKTVFQECLKKLMKNSGMFTDAELALL